MKTRLAWYFIKSRKKKACTPFTLLSKYSLNSLLPAKSKPGSGLSGQRGSSLAYPKQFSKKFGMK